MIRNFKRAGLKQMYEGKARRVDSKIRSRVARILAALDAAASPVELNLPGYALHELKGDQADTWSVKVNKNWRVTFRFDGPDACDVDLVDYH